MTRAEIMLGIVEVGRMRDRVIASIGTRPPWWRPLARSRWDAETARKNEWLASADAWIREAFEA